MNWSQLRTLLWLRWRLTRNQLTRGSSFGLVLVILASVVMGAIVLGGAVAGFLLGWKALRGRTPLDLLVVWDVVTVVFLFFWLMGLVSELQRSESIDLSRLLHLPVSLRDVFVLNYVASHFSFLFIVGTPALLALIAGLGLARGGLMLAMVPVLLTFIFMLSAWTYCLRGWLVTLMVNQRRKRTIIMGVSAAFILLAQLPNLYLNVLGPRHTMQGRPADRTAKTAEKLRALPGFYPAHHFIPVLWPSRGLMGLAAGNPWPALLGCLGAAAIGVLGLRRAYLATLRFYHGSADVRPSKPTGPSTATGSRGAPALGKRTAFLERRIPGLPEDAAALALASFRSLTRAPEIKLALGTSLAVVLVFGAMFLARSSEGIPNVLKPVAATGSVLFLFFSLLQLLFNQFGADRDGFRAYVLLPTPRSSILVGKNFALLPFCGGMFSLVLGAVTFLIRVSLETVLATILQFLAAFLLVNMVGNFASIIAPYQLAAASLKPTKIPLRATLTIIASHLLFPLIMIPVFIPAGAAAFCNGFGFLPYLPVNLIASLVLAAGSVLAYVLSLRGLGDLLEAREQRILQAVTREVE